MLRNYLTVALRALERDRLSAFINIAGLSIGLAACLMILTYVRYQLSFDAWLPEAERTYQVNWIARGGEQDGQQLAMAPYVAADALAKDFPEIEQAAAMRWSGPLVRKDGEVTRVEQALSADPNIFQVLQLPFLHGDPKTALQHPRSLVLSESEAMRLFGATDVVGRTLTLVDYDGDREMRVGGVLRDLPENSHIRFDMLTRFDRSDYADNPQSLTSWGEISGFVYVRLREGADVDAIRARLPDFERRVVPPDMVDGRPVSAEARFDIALVNVRDVNTGPAAFGFMRPATPMKTVVTFAVVAVLLLGVACVNFTNLAAARASQRAREVALRKTLGARRGQLVAQFLGESILVTAIAMLIALALVELLLPPFGAFMEAELELRYLGQEGVLLPVLLLTLVVGVAGGAYPALYISRFDPAQVLRANRSVDAHGSGRLRTALVVGQFAVSIALIICTGVIYAQTIHARSVDPGYRTDGLLMVGEVARVEEPSRVLAIKRAIERVPGVTAVARTNVGPNSSSVNNTLVRLPGEADPMLMGVYAVDGSFFRALGLETLAGRTVTEEREADVGAAQYGPDPEFAEILPSRGLNVVLSRGAAEQMGYASPQAAVGKTFQATVAGQPDVYVPTTVVGVVSDAMYRSARDPAQNMFYYVANKGYVYLAVRFEGADGAAVDRAVGSIWKRMVPDAPYQSYFADRSLAELYDGDEARGSMFAIFAALAILIACLGLYGLAAFTTERRTKEIGIRKVMGASTGDVVRLLVWQFSRPVVVANLIAWPAAWWLMRDWLDTFSDRIALGVHWFAAAGLLALLIAAATIAGHALRVARARPVTALRYE